jgi:MYXO-CTERM domain-containing protein
VILPAMCAALPLGTEPPRPPPPPTAHAVDIWMGSSDVVGMDPAFARAAERERLFPSAAPQITAPASPGLGSGFSIVGSVAVLQGDEATVAGTGARRGIEYRNLVEIGQRFIAAFGDDYDQIAVYLAFNDYSSAQSLAYQMRVKNDVKGIGLDLFDQSAAFGSASGRLQTVLNMKRILAYGRGAANDPDNDLYAVWAQEAAHRWAAYLRFKRAGDAEVSDALLGRQLAHWAKGVQADGSIMDGYLWKDNLDGTFTAVERDKRYGSLDQYAMGLLPAKEVPPFFLLQDFRRASDEVPLGDKALPLPGSTYKANKIELTINDVIRALGPREPATDAAAADLRMGVVLLTTPGVPAGQVVGESYRIDRTRHLWDGFYNEAGGGRGKVCTQLLRPCRGVSLTYGAPKLSETGKTDGVLAPGDTFKLELPITNVGERGTAQVHGDGRGAFLFTRDVATGALAAGATATLTFEGRVPLGTPCGQALPVDFTTVEKPGRANPSKGTVDLLVGATPGPSDDLESAPAWMVNPDGTDTATTGRWELGTPEPSAAFDFVVQPGAAWSGTHAFVTGAARGTDPSANDVTGGLTTLQSPPYTLKGLTRPRLSYQVYFVGADFQNEVLVPSGTDSLRVLASADGKTWIEVDRLLGMALGWQRRLISLEDKLPAEVLAAPELRFRFVAEDADVNTVVEAVIDDVGLFGEAAACSLPAPDGGAGNPGGDAPAGCACRLGAGPASTPWLALLALALVLARRRR